MLCLLRQCSKLCGGGEIIRKVLCIMDNKTVPITECDADAVLDSSDACNKQACGEGKYDQLVSYIN